MTSSNKCQDFDKFIQLICCKCRNIFCSTRYNATSIDVILRYSILHIHSNVVPHTNAVNTACVRNKKQIRNDVDRSSRPTDWVDCVAQPGPRLGRLRLLDFGRRAIIPRNVESPLVYYYLFNRWSDTTVIFSRNARLQALWVTFLIAVAILVSTGSNVL